MTLALIAGRGMLPMEVSRAQDVVPLICAYEGVSPDLLTVDVRFRLETLGTLLKSLSERGVTKVCFCGAIDRPQLDPGKLDAETLPLVPVFQKALAAGDNGALKVLKEIFEHAGFKVVGADTLLPELTADQGVLTHSKPDDQMRKDAARGQVVLAGMAPLDIGQACVIGLGQVLGIEAMGGTDHMLATLPSRAVKMRPILCKGPKVGQIREIDMPTIGPSTIEAAYRAGLAGVVVNAGEVIVLESEKCAALANQYGMVLWSRSAGEQP